MIDYHLLKYNNVFYLEKVDEQGFYLNSFDNVKKLYDYFKEQDISLTTKNAVVKDEIFEEIIPIESTIAIRMSGLYFYKGNEEPVKVFYPIYFFEKKQNYWISRKVIQGEIEHFVLVTYFSEIRVYIFYKDNVTGIANFIKLDNESISQTIRCEYWTYSELETPKNIKVKKQFNKLFLNILNKTCFGDNVINPKKITQSNNNLETNNNPAVKNIPIGCSSCNKRATLLQRLKELKNKSQAAAIKKKNDKNNNNKSL